MAMRQPSPDLASKFDRNTEEIWLPTCSSRTEVYKGHVPEESRSVDFYARLTLRLSESGSSLEATLWRRWLALDSQADEYRAGVDQLALVVAPVGLQHCDQSSGRRRPLRGGLINLRLYAPESTALGPGSPVPIFQPGAARE
jgi:hypothetical protein